MGLGYGDLTNRNVSLVPVIRGGIWLYGSMIVNNLGGFIYWLLISKIAGSYILGLTSATVGLASLINGILSLGIGLGLRHFIGLCMRDNDLECVREKYWSLVHFSIIIYLSSGLTLLVLGLLGIRFANYTSVMLLASSLIVFLGFLPVSSALAVSFLRTDILFKSAVIGNVLKVSIGVLLVYLGIGYWGAITGYMLLQLVQVVYTLYYSYSRISYSPILRNKVVVEVLKGSIVSWAPSIVLLVGQWLGVIFVFGISGAVKTGYYYIAFTLANFILGIGASVINLLLPVLSSMGEEKTYTVNRVIRFTLTILTPISLYLAVYPFLLLGLLGREYLNASTELSILLLNSIPVMIISGVNSFVYSLRDYIHVLYLGLAQSVPRIILYAIAVPLYGSLGAALSYTIGSYIGLIYVFYIVYGFKYDIKLYMFIKISFIPVALAVLMLILNIPWYYGLLLLASTYYIYYKLALIDRSDLRDLLNAVKFW